MGMFYTVSLMASVLTLSLWYYSQQHRRLSGGVKSIFFISLGLYALSMLLGAGDWASKWPVLARDLGLLAIVPVVLSVFASRKLAFFLLLGVATLFTGSLGKSTSFYTAENEWELLVELGETTDLDVLNEIAEKYGLRYERAFQMESEGTTELDDFWAVEIPESNESLLSEIMLEMANLPGVDWVEDNETVKVSPIMPARQLPRVNRKYQINDPDLQQQWSYESLNVDKYYESLRSVAGNPVQTSSIYILDTGVDANHEDLRGQFFSTNKKYDKDVRGHGTHCAGIAAAVSNNGIGVASLSPNQNFVKVTSIKVLSDYGVGNQRTIINGILEAADAGADIISMSLGGRSNTSRQRAYVEAVKYANAAGSIVVVAAGNDGALAKDISPANVEGVITVSAVDTLLNKASFSNSIKGLNRGVAAPGVAIYSTLPGNKYGALNGTSMATPFVAGLLGVLKSFQPDLTTDQAYDVLKRSGASTTDTEATGQLVQPNEALLLLLQNR